MTGKISLQDAIKQKLASQKQASNDNNGLVTDPVKNTKKMKSQLTKKPNNQRKRMGV